MWCKAGFSASSLQSSVSHDASEIILICWFGAQGYFFLLMMKTVVLLYIFMETEIFFQDSLISLSLEKSSVINVFTDLINIMHPFWIVLLFWKKKKNWPNISQYCKFYCSCSFVLFLHWIFSNNSVTCNL